MTLLLTASYVITPAIVLWLCRKIKILNKIGPVLLLYLIGIVLGNSGLIDESAFKVQDLIVTIIIPLAIPMMLFSCNFLQWNIKNAVLTLITGIIAVVIAIFAGYFIFKPLIGSDPAIGGNIDKIAGMLAGVYTGGTPNLAAIKLMLGIPNETYILIHSYDMAISLIYLTFVLSIGIKLFRKILHYEPSQKSTKSDHMPFEPEGEEPYKDFFKKENFLPVLGAAALSLLIFGIAGGLSMILPKDLQMVVVILTITSLGIGASFIKRVREIRKSYDAGMYLVYIFSMVVASMADLGRLNLAGGLYVLLYIVFVIFGSLVLQLIMARILKIDADTVLISSVSLINSPPFVPLIATAMNNRSVIITGLTVGLVGYAIGNYLGYLISIIL
ncbi:MAG: hypothetical protein A2X19_08745 [Bacteroidetes bacterium GWE2_39_28]|nr:MAG: hypothetical protein A2X19_08745 [Bacteroidetes bacterium GWE2_39_28]OFY12201.1 MAG: hypothetical protein A2X16_06550 [Bacteroidetes bacterium GWF2_39_10]OFZ08970.1 MAG: hypothetical protein A2322_01800 [Bacteroidetes bacterium RIFOXYB2_FULL_39_7]OFZ12321.1 MAG: hypothetical protein A2465_10730 [Bacteroidetes bacterium RIFOXYC2_FULL_39_11]HCT94231.1 hypothetical protein [Rikenellaceae bacterium]